jgi:CMP-N,N'-diacetyllegionaminic acid synthase
MTRTPPSESAMSDLTIPGLKVLATICARGGSKGVPGKNARWIGGRPLIAYTIDAARACPRVNHLVVSTDSDEIARLAENCGVPVGFRRPAEFATDAAAKIHAIRHATEYVERHEHFQPDLVVDLDIGVPMRSADDITGAIERLAEGDVDAVVTIYPAERNPYFNMVEFVGNAVRLVKFPAKPVVRRQDAPIVYSITPSVFGYRRDCLSDLVHLWDGRWGAWVVPRERGIDIDDEVDFVIAETLLDQARAERHVEGTR